MSSVTQSSDTGPASGALWCKVGEVLAPAGTGQRLQWHHCSMIDCYNNGGPVKILKGKDGGFWGFSWEEIDFDFDGCVLEEQIRDVVGIEDVSFSEIVVHPQMTVIAIQTRYRRRISSNTFIVLHLRLILAEWGMVEAEGVDSGGFLNGKTIVQLQEELALERSTLIGP